MLTPAYIQLKYFFYPIGNTPAVVRIFWTDVPESRTPSQGLEVCTDSEMSNRICSATCQPQLLKAMKLSTSSLLLAETQGVFSSLYGVNKAP